MIIITSTPKKFLHFSDTSLFQMIPRRLTVARNAVRASQGMISRHHETGHERWDRKGIKERNANESYKQRKVNLGSESYSSPSTLSWISANHNDLLRPDHSVQRAQDANFSTSGNVAISHELSAVSQHFGQNKAISSGYRTPPGHAPIYQTRDHSK